MTQTDFYTEISNTIQDLLANFDDKHAKLDAKFKKTIEETISDQYKIFMQNPKSSFRPFHFR